MRSIRIIAVFVIGVLLICQGCSKDEQTSTTQPVNKDSVLHTDTPGNINYAGLWKIYKDSIPGTWTWHHTYLLIVGGDSTLTTYADTVMHINPVSDSTLSIGGRILSYSDSFHYANGPYGSRVDTANFVHYWEKGQYRYDVGVPKDLLLDRLNDSLFYTINHTGTALGSQRYEYFRTKIFH